MYVCLPLQATVYKCNEDGSIAPTQAYSDTDVSLHHTYYGIGVTTHPHTHTHTHDQPEENFYTCAWSYDTETGEGLLAIGGFKGIIRILGTSTASCRAVSHLIPTDLTTH